MSPQDRTHTVGINPATKLPHTENHLRRNGLTGIADAMARTRELRAEIQSVLDHCKSKSKTRKRSVKALMRERGWEQVADAGPLETQWRRVQK